MFLGQPFPVLCRLLIVPNENNKKVAQYTQVSLSIIKIKAYPYRPSMLLNLLFQHVFIGVNNVYDAAPAKQWPLQLQTVATASSSSLLRMFFIA